MVRNAYVIFDQNLSFVSRVIGISTNWTEIQTNSHSDLSAHLRAI